MISDTNCSSESIDKKAYQVLGNINKNKHLHSNTSWKVFFLIQGQTKVSLKHLGREKNSSSTSNKELHWLKTSSLQH